MAWIAFVPQETDGGPVHLLCWHGGELFSQVLDERFMAGNCAPQWTAGYWLNLTASVLPEIRAQAGLDSTAHAIYPLDAGDRVPGALVIMPPPEGAFAESDGRFLSLLLDRAARAMRCLALENERDALRGKLQEAECDLARLRERVLLSERLAGIGELVSGVAHELNNALTSVIGYVQLLQTGDMPAVMRPDLEIIDSEAARCQRIAQNLLYSARQQEPETISVSINDLIRRTLELKAYGLRTDGIRAELDLQPDLPDVWADPCRIQQVLLNLVNNAQEAMGQARGSGVLTISSRSLQEDGRPMVRVGVADSGPGVPAEIGERVFEPFFSTKPRHNGTGLGLSISKQIVHESGGQLWLDTGYQGGAKFVVDLPTDHASGQADSSRNEAKPKPTRGGSTVLFVDDETDLVDLADRVLHMAGHHVIRALSGEEALLRLAEQRYDAVVLDIKMPTVGGREVYRVIQEQYPDLAGRVVLTTGDVANDRTIDWLEATGCRVLAKPFDIAQLLEAVQSVLLQEPT
jgi:two-component system NtrC family sensor kinase